MNCHCLEIIPMHKILRNNYKIGSILEVQHDRFNCVIMRKKKAMAYSISQPQHLICSTSFHMKAVILTGFDFISIRLSNIRVTGRFCCFSTKFFTPSITNCDPVFITRENRLKTKTEMMRDHLFKYAFLSFMLTSQFPLKSMELKYQVIPFVMKYILQTTGQSSVWQYTCKLAVGSSPINRSLEF